MNMPFQRIMRIPMAGTEPVLSVLPLLRQEQEENPVADSFSNHLFESLAAAFGMPHGLLGGMVESTKMTDEMRSPLMPVELEVASNQVANLGGLVMKPEDFLEAGGGSAGKIIDRDAEKRAAESEADVQRRKQKPNP